MSNFNIFTIPTEVLQQICMWLPCYDMLPFLSTCSKLQQLSRSDYLWQRLLVLRFNAFTEHDNHLELYKQLHLKCTLITGDKLSIIWNDNNHWSINGSCAILTFVWWFEVKCLFKGVYKGIYEPILHLEFQDAWGLDGIHCHAFVEDDVDSKSEYNLSTLDGFELNNGQIEIKMPRMTIGNQSDYSNVKFEMTNFEGTIKRGLIIHSIELKRIVSIAEKEIIPTDPVDENQNLICSIL